MPKLDTGNGREHDYTKVFSEFGVDFTVNGSAEAVADECPWCGKDRFYLNVTTGQYHCKHCGEKGNVTTYLTWAHRECLARTTDDHYRQLKDKRGIPLQTLKRHGLAYDEDGRRWLIPFKSPKGNVVNIQLYYPERPKGKNKRNLPGLPLSIYGFEQLSHKERIVLICEGPFDAIALDHSIGSNNRSKYAIVATPGAFKAEWAPHFAGRKVRAFYDNDKGGEQHREKVRKLLGESGVAAELKVLTWPDGLPDGYDINDLVREHKGRSVLGYLDEHSRAVTAEPKLAWSYGRDGAASGPEKIDWVWPDRLRCGSYASFSGKGGSFKSTIAREITARYTKGEAMPFCEQAGMPAGHVIYAFAEETEAAVRGYLQTAGADLDRVILLPAVLKDGDPLNVLDHLEEVRQKVREYQVRLLIIDGQNSVVGAPNISTDMLARYNVTNKLHRFAQRENLCLLGIRNEDAEGRAYGPASMGDIARCILRAVEVPHDGTDPYFRLEFVKVSDSPKHRHPPIPYSVEDLGGSSRKILWGKVKPKGDGTIDVTEARKVKAAFDARRAAAITQSAKGARP